MKNKLNLRFKTNKKPCRVNFIETQIFIAYWTLKCQKVWLKSPVFAAGKNTERSLRTIWRGAKNKTEVIMKFKAIKTEQVLLFAIYAANATFEDFVTDSRIETAYSQHRTFR